MYLYLWKRLFSKADLYTNSLSDVYSCVAHALIFTQAYLCHTPYLCALTMFVAAGEQCLACYAINDTWFPHSHYNEMRSQLPDLQVKLPLALHLLPWIYTVQRNMDSDPQALSCKVPYCIPKSDVVKESFGLCHFLATSVLSLKFIAYVCSATGCKTFGLIWTVSSLLLSFAEYRDEVPCLQILATHGLKHGFCCSVEQSQALARLLHPILQQAL